MKTNSESKKISFLKGREMMRKLILFTFSILIVSALSVKNVSAIPNLQLDIGDGWYDGSTETIVTDSNSFNLYALLDSANTNTDLYYLSIAISPMVDTATDLGSFVFNGNTINATTDMTYGTPPADASRSMDLASHGIYDTYYYEYEFNFSDATGCYNAQDTPGGFTSGGTGCSYASFAVDWSGLADGYNLHFDLYNTDFKYSKKGNDPALYVDDFAPFSHDAGTTTQVPEPGTLLLLGSGLVGLGLFGRRRKE